MRKWNLCGVLPAVMLLGAFVCPAFAESDSAVTTASAGSATVTTAAIVLIPRVSYSVNNANAMLQALFKQAEEQRDHGDYDGVIATMQQALHFDAKNADIYAFLGDAQAAKMNFADAIKNYTIAVGDAAGQNWSSSRMGDGDLQIRFAMLLSRAGEYDRAAEMYKTGYEALMPEEKKSVPSSINAKDLKNDTNNARLRLRTLGRTLLGLKYGVDGYATQADAQLQAALRDDETDAAAAALFLANFRSAAGKKDEAVALWQKAVALGTGNVKKLAQASLTKAQ